MEKIKQFWTGDNGRSILTIIIVILVGVGSFGLGRLSKESSNTGIKIEYPNLPANSLSALESMNSSQDGSDSGQTELTSKTQMAPKSSTNPAGKTFFASSRGSKYYSIGCSGGKTLKPENKIYFATEAEAIRAGYEKSSTCK